MTGRAAVRWFDHTGIMTHTVMLESCCGKSSNEGHELCVISEMGDQYGGLLSLIPDCEEHLTFKLHTEEGGTAGEVWTYEILSFYCVKLH